jgi:hypothetical protein
MKIIGNVSNLIQPVTKSIGTAATKASATVKKASEIALKILKALFTPITYLCTRAKSFFDKRREEPTKSPEASAQGELASPPPAQDSDSASSSQGGSAVEWPPSSFQGGSPIEQMLINSIAKATDPNLKRRFEELLEIHKRQNPS